MTFITQVLLPRRDNEGRRFGREEYRPFQARMMAKFRGWTRTGQAEGAWLAASGQSFSDEHWVYEIGHSRANLRFWQAEKERLKKKFGQQEIWIIQYKGRRI
jgi:hypothetical protein